MTDQTELIARCRCFIGAWLFWAVGDAVSRLNLDSFMWGFNLYQWAMRKSVDMQDRYLGHYWPWGAEEPSI